MQIDNVAIYDFSESVVASGLPMTEDYDDRVFDKSVIQNSLMAGDTKDEQRAEKLADNPSNSGHCNFLKGIIVCANVSGTIKWWEQMQRYHFVTIISSMSTMHRITKMDPDKCMSEHVIPEIREQFRNLVESYKRGDVDFDTLIDSAPLGIVLTARIQTNYLQLRTIWNQRKNHKYHEWGPFCRWIESLPNADKFITVE